MHYTGTVRDIANNLFRVPEICTRLGLTTTKQTPVHTNIFNNETHFSTLTHTWRRLLPALPSNNAQHNRQGEQERERAKGRTQKFGVLSLCGRGSAEQRDQFRDERLYDQNALHALTLAASSVVGRFNYRNTQCNKTNNKKTITFWTNLLGIPSFFASSPNARE